MKLFIALSLFSGSAHAFVQPAAVSRVTQSKIQMALSAEELSAAVGEKVTDKKVVVFGVAADSGCGKSTFMRRLTSIFGGDTKLMDIGRETNTLVSDATTVICLDDYHLYDRTGRAENDITALHKDCQNWDL